MFTYLYYGSWMMVLFSVTPEVMVKEDVIYAGTNGAVTFGCIITGEPIGNAYWTFKDDTKEINSNWKYLVRQMTEYSIAC